MANHQINITKNGKTTLATAGKYCDRNVDIVVDVEGGGETLTQFTNLVDNSDAIIKYGYRPTTSGYVETEYAVAIAIKVPVGKEVKVRFRGCMYAPFLQPVNNNLYCAETVTTDGYTAFGRLEKTVSLDEYGDMTITVPNPLKEYIIFGMGAVYNSSDYDSFTQSVPIEIITLNEPIGNGGYVG